MLQQCSHCHAWFHPACTNEFVAAPGDLPAYCRNCAGPYDALDDNYSMADIPETEFSVFLQDAVRDHFGKAAIVTSLSAGCLHGKRGRCTCKHGGR